LHNLSPNTRGIIYMVLAAGAFVTNDTFLKLATEDGLPPFQALFLRGISATIWCLPLVAATGGLGKLRMTLNGWVVIRNLCEFGAVVFFIIALKNVDLADITAINMTSPLLLLLGCSFFFGERLGALRFVLIAGGFVGALLVAQPSGQGASPYLLLGFVCALGGAGRDLAGRMVAAHIPTVVVAYATILTVMTGSGIAHLLFEEWQAPTGDTWLYVGGAGLFLTFGQFLLFLSYRTGATHAVAPFFYTFAVWAVISGLLVFGSLPNPLALVGIVLIIGTGVSIALHDDRRRRLGVVA
jgi:drug/metabolite transporter (DMT)-like permease